MRVLRTRIRAVRSRRLRRTDGQSLVETLIALTMIMAMVIGLIHLSFLAATRHVCNFAAFTAARILAYGGGERGRADQAARTITAMLPRGTVFLRASPGQGCASGECVKVQVQSPFAYPLSGPGGRVVVASEAPLYEQPTIGEVGDNAQR